MQKPTFDPGLTNKYSGPLRRIINPDGSFNVQRKGTDWRDVNPYLHLVSTPWVQFFLTIFAVYTLVNVIYAVVYFSLGPGALQGRADAGEPVARFFECFFFSSQTLTTVGFGALAPRSGPANLIAAVEALTGLLRFRRRHRAPVRARIQVTLRPHRSFSKQAIVAPYQEGTSLQFRLVNRRANTLIEPAVTLMLMTVDRSGPEHRREFKILHLEREKIMLFPLTWTVVHPIDAESPLRGKTARDLEELQAELMVLVKAWDETFAQTVHQRFSYRFSEIEWGRRFTPAFDVDDAGSIAEGSREQNQRRHRKPR